MFKAVVKLISLESLGDVLYLYVMLGSVKMSRIRVTSCDKLNRQGWALEGDNFRPTERMFLVDALCDVASRFEMPRKIILLFLMKWNPSRKFMIICNMLALFSFIIKAVTINEFLPIPIFHFRLYSCCFWGKIIHSCSVLLLMMFSTFLYFPSHLCFPFLLPHVSAHSKCACVYMYGHVCEYQHMGTCI